MRSEGILSSILAVLGILVAQYLGLLLNEAVFYCSFTNRFAAGYRVLVISSSCTYRVLLLTPHSLRQFASLHKRGESPQAARSPEELQALLFSQFHSKPS